MSGRDQMLVILDDREISAGTDLESGQPYVELRGLEGIDIQSNRLLIDKRTAVTLGAQLLSAGDPSIARHLLELLCKAGRG